MKNEKTLIEEKKEKEEKEKSNTLKFNECNHLLKTTPATMRHAL